MVYQLVGNCGVGKTWVMLQLLNSGDYKPYKFGLWRYMSDGKRIIVGKYDGSTFQGSDKLAMNIASQFNVFKKLIDKTCWDMLVEGDRFMNSTFREVFNPTVLKIDGDGLGGRLVRNSVQTPVHLKRINTRVQRYQEDITFVNSKTCLEYLQARW